MGSKLVCCLLFFSLIWFAAGCGGGAVSASGSTAAATPTPTPVPTPSPTPTPFPAADHVFLVLLENHAFNQVIGSPFMPYLNSLAAQHSLATNYFANTHPSIGNYFMLTTGNIETNNDAFTGTVSSDSIPRAFAAAGKTWKAYMESLPSVGYTGGDVYPYFKHHNPFAYMTDVLGSSAETANLVPFTQLSSDLTAGTLPSFGFIAPNAEDDAHDCPTGGSACLDTAKLTAADNWLKTHIDPLIHSPTLANSVFIIVFDESLDVDVINGGGQVAMVMAGSHVKAGFKSTTLYQHQSTLRLVLDLLGVADHPGDSATAPTMQEFFQ
ncbi:MAG TPA: alkaline phosphatase family protein [Candidatus Acidoferrales bacterium]|nr:alkaline phosphatase family protein [Candidatus Acidoferrales bacterium]